MRVSFERKPRFDHVFNDPQFNALVEAFKEHKVVRAFIVRAIHKHEEPPPALMFAGSARIWAAAASAETVAVAVAAGAALDALYQRHGTMDGRMSVGKTKVLRGAILEGLVRERLRGRYETGDLADNVVITVENGVSFTTPDDRPIDVAGWDGSVGECHDCKMSPLRLDISMLKHLEGLPKAIFKIGVVSAGSFSAIKGALTLKGYAVPSNMTLISLEKLMDFAPLQRRGTHGAR